MSKPSGNEATVDEKKYSKKYGRKQNSLRQAQLTDRNAESLESMMGL